MRQSLQSLDTPAQWICRILEQWFGFSCDLTGLSLGDGDVLADLAAGRD